MLEAERIASIRLCLARISDEICLLEELNPADTISQLFDTATEEINRVSTFAQVAMPSQSEFEMQLKQYISKISQRYLLEIHLHDVPHMIEPQPWSAIYLIIQDFIDLLFEYCPQARYLIISFANLQGQFHLKLLTDGIVLDRSDVRWRAIESRVRFYGGELRVRVREGVGMKVGVCFGGSIQVS